jgi:hypothetical protein
MDQNGHWWKYPLGDTFFDMLEKGIEDETPLFERKTLSVGNSGTETEEAPMRWERMQVIKGPVGSGDHVAGGADSDQKYIGDDPDERAFCERIGIGISTEESCFVRALRVSGKVPAKILNEISAEVRTQFIGLKQAKTVLDDWKIPACLNSYGPKPKRSRTCERLFPHAEI